MLVVYNLTQLNSLLKKWQPNFHTRTVISYDSYDISVSGVVSTFRIALKPGVSGEDIFEVIKGLLLSDTDDVYITSFGIGNDAGHGILYQIA